MTANNIPIRNLYYMLLYALHLLNDSTVSKRIDSEKFENVPDLCAEILYLMISRQLKHGLKREYQSQSDAILPLIGKIEITESIKSGTFFNKRLVCSWHELSVDSYINRIVKTTANLLINSANLSEERRINLKKLMTFFKDVKILKNIRKINWNIHYNNNDYVCKMLINYCRMIIENLLLSHKNGKILLKDFFDEKNLSKLYEKFILGYYQQEFKNEVCADSEHINWELDENNMGDQSMLPTMRTDVTLKNKNSILIIDAKYYGRIKQKRYDNSSEKFHSHNLYQIFSYVKNKNYEEQKNRKRNVSGMLLYAKTDAKI